MRDNTILLNCDFDMEYYFLKYYASPETAKDKAAEFLDRYYKDRGIGDILFNIFSQSSVTPTLVFTDTVAKLHTRCENGIAVDYSGCEYLALKAAPREKYGVGLTELWIEHCKEIGIRPWFSVRMNDHHYCREQTSFLRGDFFYEALKNGWVLGDGYRSGFRDWDYAVPQVRQKMLDYISEQLDALDVYGVELDFMREPKCVKYKDPGDHCAVMTSFMESVKAVVAKKEAKRGHPIRIAARLPRDPMLARRIGFDAREWARLGVIDAVSPSGHWLCTDNAMPIAEWADMLSPYGTEVWAGMEMNLPERLMITAETAKAHTAQYAAQGSARTYVYNLYHPFFDKVENYRGIWAKALTADEITRLWEVCGDPEKCSKGVRRHVVTEESTGFQEIKPRFHPLPLTLGEGAVLEVQTGPIGENDVVTVFLRADNAGELEISFNGWRCPPSDDKDADVLRSGVSPDSVISFRVPAPLSEKVSQTLWLTGRPDAVIKYVEIKIDAK